MKKTRIGIPRTFYYHRYGILWQSFFRYLNCNVILSPSTNKEILTLGTKNINNQYCLSYKIYLGHIMYLSNRCDYILLPRIYNYSKNNKVCPRYSEIYDTARNFLFKEQILSYNINHPKLYFQTLGLLRISLKFTKNPIKIIYSYIKALKKQQNYNIAKQNETKNKLSKPGKKVLIVANFYNSQDKYVTEYITKCLEDNHFILINCNYLDHKIATAFSNYFSNNLPWKYSKEMLGAIYYYKYHISGLLFISTANCPIDSLINKQVIYKNSDIPICNIIVTEEINRQHLKTTLTTFIDKINKN